MPSQGPLSPGTVVHVAGANYDWVTPEEAASSNNNYAVVTIAVPFGASDLLRATNFGFDLPAGSTIDGVVVEIEANSEQALVSDSELYLVKAGARTGADRSQFLDFWPVTDDGTYRTRGGASDLWGATLSVADVEDSGFGVELLAFNSDEISDKTGNIDHIRMTVYYNEGPEAAGVTTPDYSRFPRHRLRRTG